VYGLAILVLTIVLSFAFLAYKFVTCCLADLTTPDVRVRYFTKRAWLIIIVVSIPLRGIFYLLVGRDNQ
jgi:hypothetical protein